jgi:hypothetical protein
MLMGKKEELRIKNEQGTGNREQRRKNNYKL